VPTSTATAAPASPPLSENNEPLVNCARIRLSKVVLFDTVLPMKLWKSDGDISV
jgi:hypothetical protein